MSMSKWFFEVEGDTPEAVKEIVRGMDMAANVAPGVVVIERTWVGYASAKAGRTPYRVWFNGVQFDRTAG